MPPPWPADVSVLNSEREKAEQVLNQQTRPRHTRRDNSSTNHHCLQTPPHPWSEDSAILIDAVFFKSYLETRQLIY